MARHDWMLAPLIATDSWPDRVDLVILAGYLLVIVGVPIAGYALLAVDIRAHYRRFRRALVVVSGYTNRLPAWVAREAQTRQQTPACLAAFGLSLPCTQEELLEAYRERVKTLHPDRGGTREEFLKLQQFFEEARALLADRN